MANTRLSRLFLLGCRGANSLGRRLYHSKGGIFGLRIRQKDSSRLPTTGTTNHDRALVELVAAYQNHGHRKANVDPLHTKARSVPEIEEKIENARTASLPESFSFQGLVFCDELTGGSLADLVNYLERVYCGRLGLETLHLPNEEERRWLVETFEKSSTTFSLSPDKKKHIGEQLIRSQAFDNFLGKKFGHIKRYGAEGAESLLCFMDTAFSCAAEGGLEHVMIAMAHRGRLNFLVDLLKVQPELLFYKMQGNSLVPESYCGSGDVLSHIVNSVDLKYGDKSVHVSLLPNPSHLEAVNPVAVGKARARQLSLRNGEYSESEQNDKVLCIQVHGDAAFPAQGIVSETLNMAQLPHYSIGGSLHLIVNNQLGFTTPADRGRSTPYASDIGKFTDLPVFHVNGDSPEDVIRACQLALEYQMRYGRDVIVDMMCYRRWGHNELDDPSVTQPSMYGLISSRQSVPDLYIKEAADTGLISEDYFAQKEKEYSDQLNSALSSTNQFQPQELPCRSHWSAMVQPTENVTLWDTGYPIDALKYIGMKSVSYQDLNLHPRLPKSHVNPRLEQLQNGASIDWATAEALAVGSLLHQGFNVRLSGQDVGRGTFSHRHMMLIDQSTDEMYIPLNDITSDQKGFLEIANSPLSEEAVIGFEYGMSIESPQNLIIWEAQFGDFFSGAQVIIDTFVSSGETKWMLQSGLVMLLPHGMDGAGPEHSSCRIERFLQLCDSHEDKADGDAVNLCVANPTTPAQYFHLLRRQLVRNFRKPLIVASPKLILRSPLATSSLAQFAPGTSFQPVIGDFVSADSAKKVVFCSGKHFYALDLYKHEKNVTGTALVRLESLCPFPAEELKRELSKYKNASEFVWSQEEHQNMGPWSFIQRRFQRQLNVNLTYAGRGPLAAPAVGNAKTHKREHEQILIETFTM
eukprot:m.154340 g.154340  ORF g.154340 m.154340 type:complete len:917 (+) comp38634_c1_seq23:40-2790(+)